MKIKEWIYVLTNKFKNFENPLLEANILLGYVLKKKKSWLISFEDYNLNHEEEKKLKKLIFRKLLGEPTAYIIKKKEFWSLSFKVSNNVMIPRPDTELLVEHSLKKIKKYGLKRILDLGTGSGSIAISIAKNAPSVKILAVDYCKKALKIAKLNAKNIHVKNVKFILSNWFTNIKFFKFDLIVSNPPYIGKLEFKKIQKNLIFEPKCAFLSKYNGLFSLQKIIFFSKFYLKKKGWLFIEHGWNQKNDVYKFFKLNKYTKIKIYKDYGNNFRLIAGQQKYTILK